MAGQVKKEAMKGRQGAGTKFRNIQPTALFSHSPMGCIPRSDWAPPCGLACFETLVPADALVRDRCVFVGDFHLSTGLGSWAWSKKSKG